MVDDRDRGEFESKLAAGRPDTCPLDRHAQTRNLIVFGVNTWLFYLASPVLLVGFLHASLCSKLGASDAVANLPSSAYLIFAMMPVLIAWYFPAVAQLKRVLVVSYSLLALVGALVVASLLLPLPNGLQLAMLVLHGGVTGGALTVATMFLFEVLQLGVSETRRGPALSLGYGVGPVFAVLGSLTSQLLLSGRLGPVDLGMIPYPWNFATIFAASVPAMLLAALLANRLLIIPLPVEEATRQSFWTSVFGGLADFLGNRALLITAMVGILGFAAYQIGPNMTLYTEVATGTPADQYVGYQLALRFSFKVMSGLFVGWLLTRTHPKASMLATASFGLSGIAWALLVPGEWFLLGFGLLGAGELFGVYLTNYIMCCSTKAQTRRNVGFASLLLFPAAPAAWLFGSISDFFGEQYSRTVGFQLSFALAIVFLGSALLLTGLLPARPRPQEAEPALPGTALAGAEKDLGLPADA
jgi:hypothetical protein